MIQIAVCENDEASILRLRQLLDKSNQPYNMTVYNNGGPLLWDIKTSLIYYDVFFIATNLNEQDGFEIARHIIINTGDALIVFLSPNTQITKKEYQDLAFGSLIKPVNDIHFERIYSKVLEKAKAEQSNIISITHRSHTFNIRHSYISYISHERGKIFIHLRGQECRQHDGRFTDFVGLLSNGVFLRCHRNYIINLNRVNALISDGFLLGDTIIPISKKYSKLAVQRYNKHLFDIFDQD